MGGGPSTITCISYPIQQVAVFPSVTAISDLAKQEDEASKLAQAISKVVSAPASPIPYVGKAIAAIIPVLVGLSFSGVNDNLVKAFIDERIAAAEIEDCNAELAVVRDNLQDAEHATDHHLELLLHYARDRTQVLFEKFDNKRHVLRKYPLVTLPYFAKVCRVLWATCKISSALYPHESHRNDKLLHRMQTTISQFAEEFFQQRTRNLKCQYCRRGYTKPNVCIIEDNAWKGTPFRGELCEYVPWTGVLAIEAKISDFEPYKQLSDCNYYSYSQWNDRKPNEYVTALQYQYTSIFKTLFPTQEFR